MIQGVAAVCGNLSGAIETEQIEKLRIMSEEAFTIDEMPGLVSKSESSPKTIQLGKKSTNNRLIKKIRIFTINLLNKINKIYEKILILFIKRSIIDNV